MKNKRWMGSIFRMIAACASLVMAFGITALAAGTQDVTLQNKEKGVYIYQGRCEDYSTTVYHRFEMKKPGYIVVGGTKIISESMLDLNIQLCDAKKKVVGGPVYVGYEKNTDYAIFGVGKGTHYIKVSGEKDYALYLLPNECGDKGGVSKKKAANIKQKKKINGILPVGEKAKKADWFKFKIKKAKKVNISISFQGQGYIRAYLYGPSYPKGIYMGSQSSLQRVNYNTINKLTGKKAKIKPGTYYLKIMRGYAGVSGGYDITWK